MGLDWERENASRETSLEMGSGTSLAGIVLDGIVVVLVGLVVKSTKSPKSSISCASLVGFACGMESKVANPAFEVVGFVLGKVLAAPMVAEADGKVAN